MHFEEKKKIYQHLLLGSQDLLLGSQEIDQKQQTPYGLSTTVTHHGHITIICPVYFGDEGPTCCIFLVSGP